MSTTSHWTERSVEDFLYRIAADFVDQLQLVMNEIPLSQSDLAKRLGISSGRVSQIFNNPGNLTLRKVIQYARALGLKVAVVAYDDNDPKNEHGPINSDVFRLCWQNAGSPNNFQQLNATSVATSVSVPYADLFFDSGYRINERYVGTPWLSPSAVGSDATFGLLRLHLAKTRTWCQSSGGSDARFGLLPLHLHPGGAVAVASTHIIVAESLRISQES